MHLLNVKALRILTRSFSFSWISRDATDVKRYASSEYRLFFLQARYKIWKVGKVGMVGKVR
jgi:hypothetical protein